jgi:Family of unknown function (DUF6376)
MSRLRLLTVALVSAAALFVVACDGDTAEKNDYVDEVNEVQSTLQSDISKLAQSPRSPEQLVGFYEETVASLESAVDSLENIEPPDEVAELHDRLITEVQDLADVITGAVDEIEQGGAAALPGAVSQLATEGTRIQTEFSSTIDEINSTLQD